MHLLRKKLEAYSIILGSQSPRRRELLQGLDVNFEVKVKNTDESYPLDLPHTEVPAFIARKKFEAFIPELHENDFLITADTIVINDSEILHKPTSILHAKELIKKLSNNTHTVVTGVCFGTKNNLHVFSETTTVTFIEIADEDIDYYVQAYKPLDKAGAYGVQEWIGYVGISHINGSYFNVMGLPVHSLYANILKNEI